MSDYNAWGIRVFKPEVELPPEAAAMHDPVRCRWCGTVYDLGTVTVEARYVDCSMWRCPGCNNLVDDRGETGWKSYSDYTRLRRRS